jgi:capsular polysaccharide transport system permease protein
MDDEDEEDLLVSPRRRRNAAPRRIASDGGERGLVGRLKARLPILFPEPPPADMPAQLQLLLDMRSRRLRGFALRMSIFVVVPCLLVLFYTALIATKRYVSSFQVTYQVYQPITSVGGGLLSTTPSNSDAIDYGNLIQNYVASEALAERLDQQLNLRAYYGSSKIDWTSRLPAHATDGQYFSYYSNHVSVSEGFGGYVTVTVQAFDPAFTLKLAQTIDQDANEMLDGMTAQARAAELKAATDSMNDATTQLANINLALTNFRNTHGDLDPSQIATEIGAIEGTLESQLADVKAQLAQADANMQPNAAQIVQLNLQVAALQKQIDEERARLANGDGQPNYANVVAQYQTLLAQQQLALTNYQAAQQGLLAAKTDAAREQNYVVDYVAPTLPDRPTAPDPLMSTAEAFVACMVVYSILNLLYSAMRDQTGV